MGDFLLVFSAVVSGWLLGRHLRLRRTGNQGYRRYYRGLNHLLNEQTDETIDLFIDSLDVNSDTLETHLAVGNLMRRKGEVERAIRIHQNLLSRPNLNAEQQHQAHLELARDFVSAGLLDRAERLLLDLVNQSSSLRDVSLRQLMEIYQDEREWQRAIEVGRSLLPRRGRLLPGTSHEQLNAALGHYHCELAEQALERGSLQRARALIKQALQHDRQGIRASLLAAEVELRAGQTRQALRQLRRIPEQDPAMVPEMIDQLRDCYRQMEDPEGYLRSLKALLEDHPSTRLLLAVAGELRDRQGDESAMEFLQQRLTQRPTLRGLSCLLSWVLERQSNSERERLALLDELLRQLLQDKPNYQCQQCGFTARRLHWLCPGCKQWNTIKPIRGLEGD